MAGQGCTYYIWGWLVSFYKFNHKTLNICSVLWLLTFKIKLSPQLSPRQGKRDTWYGGQFPARRMQWLYPRNRIMASSWPAPRPSFVPLGLSIGSAEKHGNPYVMYVHELGLDLDGMPFCNTEIAKYAFGLLINNCGWIYWGVINSFWIDGERILDSRDGRYEWVCSLYWAEIQRERVGVFHLHSELYEFGATWQWDSFTNTKWRVEDSWICRWINFQ